MKYLIVETSGSAHEKSIFSIASVLRSKYPDCEIRVYATGDNYKRVVGAAPTDIDFILEGSFFKLLMLAYTSEIIIFNTSSVRTCVPNLFISILNWGKNVYYIRNANSWLKFPRIFPGLKYFPHRLVQYICKTFMLLSRKSILVEKWTIKEYVENRLVIKNVDVIPFILKGMDEHTVVAQGGVFNIAIPGIVNFDKKKYQLIVDACKECAGRGLRFEISLLGRVEQDKDLKILNQCKPVVGDHLIFFDKFIEQCEYDEYIKKASVILGVFKVGYQDKYIDEKYGTTKGSGVDAHAFSNSKILIVNDDYPVDIEYKDATFFYNDLNSLSLLLSQLIQDESIKYSAQLSAIECSKQYTLESIKSRLEFL